MAAARALFKAKTSRGQSSSAASSDKIHTVHESAVASLRLSEKGTLTTTGFDGKLVAWSLKESAGKVAGALAAMTL